MTIPEFLRTQKQHTGNYLSLAIGLGVTNGLLLIIQAWLLSNVISMVIFEQADLPAVKSWLWAMLGLFAIRAILAWASEQAAFHAAVKVKLEMRNRLYRHLLALGPVHMNGERSGEAVNTLVDGVEALEAYYARFLPSISLMALVPLSILVFIFPTDWISALIMLVTAPLIPLFMILIGKGAEKLNQKQWRRLARMSAHFLDVIQGLTTLKLFNVSRREAETVSRISDEYRRDTMSVLRVAFLSSLALEFFATVSIAIVAVIIGFRLLWGEIDFQHGFFVLLLAPEFYLPLRNMGVNYHARMEAIGASERMLEILQTPLHSRADNQQSLLLTSPPAIRFENIHYQYADDRQALQNTSFEIAAGERVAVVGPSGSGKSTILNLLLGFIQPQQGRVWINDQPLSEVDLHSWLVNLAWVPQQPRLFQGSLLENIKLGLVEANPEQIRLAIEQARADEFIDRLPDGLNTQIGEAGKGLSGGQIQRIALARAFLKDSPLVILDEATANLDRVNEKLVMDAIDNLASQRTLMMIAHRLDTVKQADRILVIQNGRVQEQGDHSSLLQQQGLYQQLVQAYEV